MTPFFMLLPVMALAASLLALPPLRKPLVAVVTELLLALREMFVILPLRAITGRRKPDYARIRRLEIDCGLVEPEAPAITPPGSRDERGEWVDPHLHREGPAGIEHECACAAGTALLHLSRYGPAHTCPYCVIARRQQARGNIVIRTPDGRPFA